VAEAATAPAVFIDTQTALLLVVVVLLALVLGALADVRRRIGRLEAAPAPEPAPAARSAGARLPGELVAVLAAAAAAAVGRAHRIVAVRAVAPEAQAWSLEGRRQVFQSHHIR
jgi:hypothetical protein